MSANYFITLDQWIGELTRVMQQESKSTLNQDVKNTLSISKNN